MTSHRLNLGALYVAVQKNDKPKIFDLLSQPGLNVCETLHLKCEPVIYFAVLQGDLEVVKSFLLHDSFFVNDNVMTTLLNVAIELVNFEVLRILLITLSKSEPPEDPRNISCYIRCKSDKLSDAELSILQIIEEYKLHLRWADCLESAFEQQNIGLAKFIVNNRLSRKEDFPADKLRKMMLFAYKTGNAQLCDLILTQNILHVDQLKSMCKYYPSCKADVAEALMNNSNGHQCFTVLHTACLLGHSSIVSLALPSNESISNYSVFPLLCAAVENEHLDIVRILANAIDKSHMNYLYRAFHTAACCSSEPVLQLLSQYCPNQSNIIEYTDSAGRTYLHSAVVGGKVENVRFILKLGVGVNNADLRKMTALHLATLLKDDLQSLEVVEALVERGATIDILSSEGLSPLAYACSKGHLDVVKYLLSKGADPCFREYDLYVDNSPLFAAFQHSKADRFYDQSRQVEIMKLILDAGRRQGYLNFHIELSNVIANGFKTPFYEPMIYESVDVYDFFTKDISVEIWRKFELPLVKCLFDSIPTIQCEIPNMIGVLKDLDSVDAVTGWTSLDFMNYIDILFEQVVKFIKQYKVSTLFSNLCILFNWWKFNPCLGKYVAMKLCGLVDYEMNASLESLCSKHYAVDVLSLLRNCGLVNQTRELLVNDSMFQTPLCLQAISRIKIRQQMYKHSGNIEPNISCLMLPSKLQEYLLFDEL